ncbi:MAG: DUF86 domain-containing protein [Nitrospirae bacterium]|nr:DUF86 domain-containing protein [Nitrospirota bacterium]MCL5977023.1 DUF86 domain-containing protein [Nitrospirota bacterium]
MTRDFSLFAEDILASITWIEQFTASIEFEQFLADEKTKTAVVKKLEILGEAAKNIPKTVRDKHKNLPWADMARMRDKLSHEYFGVRYDIVWKVVKEKLPVIKPLIEKLISDLKKEKA